jgi:hypothetical protein
MSQLNDALTDTSSASRAQAPAPSMATVEDLKTQAAQAAETAKSSLSAMAAEARGKVNEIVDTQKRAGADQLSGFARAAHTAAGELEATSPSVARLVHDAAATVDEFAGNLRASDLRDVLSSVSSFARQQPVAFFAGSVLAGFALARFLKSDAEVSRASPPARYSGGLDADTGYRTWSATHPDGTPL